MNQVGKTVQLIGEGGYLVCALLIRYDQSSDSYDAIAFHNGTIKVAVIGGTEAFAAGVGKKEAEICYAPLMHGLRQYPYEARPNYAFQFVMAGEDTAPLYAIAQANQAADPIHNVPDESPSGTGQENTAEGGATVITPPEPQPEPQPSAERDHANPADYDKDGVVTKREQKRYNKEHPEDEGTI